MLQVSEMAKVHIVDKLVRLGTNILTTEEILYNRKVKVNYERKVIRYVTIATARTGIGIYKNSKQGHHYSASNQKVTEYSCICLNLQR